MKCGNRKLLGIHEHDTVAEVRACYGVVDYPRGSSDKTQDFIPQTTPPTSPKLPKIHEPNGKIPVPRAAIDALKEKPGNDIPGGFYATPSLTGNNDLDFWHVKKGKRNWEGYTFVSRVVGGRDDAEIPRDSKKRVKTQSLGSKVNQLAAFQAIRDYGVEASNERFGVELKYCRECGIHLTDETSRSLGIGPICRDKS